MKQARPQHIFKYHCMQHLTCRAAIRPVPVSNAAGDGDAKLVRKLGHSGRPALMQGALTCWSIWPSKQLPTGLTSASPARCTFYVA